MGGFFRNDNDRTYDRMRTAQRDRTREPGFPADTEAGQFALRVWRRPRLALLRFAVRPQRRRHNAQPEQKGQSKAPNKSKRQPMEIKTVRFAGLDWEKEEKKSVRAAELRRERKELKQMAERNRANVHTVTRILRSPQREETLLSLYQQNRHVKTNIDLIFQLHLNAEQTEDIRARLRAFRQPARRDIQLTAAEEHVLLALYENEDFKGAFRAYFPRALIPPLDLSSSSDDDTARARRRRRRHRRDPSESDDSDHSRRARETRQRNTDRGVRARRRERRSRRRQAVVDHARAEQIDQP